MDIDRREADSWARNEHSSATKPKSGRLDQIGRGWRQRLGRCLTGDPRPREFRSTLAAPGGTPPGNRGGRQGFGGTPGCIPRLCSGWGALAVRSISDAGKIIGRFRGLSAYGYMVPRRRVAAKDRRAGPTSRPIGQTARSSIERYYRTRRGRQNAQRGRDCPSVRGALQRLRRGLPSRRQFAPKYGR